MKTLIRSLTVAVLTTAILALAGVPLIGSIALAIGLAAGVGITSLPHCLSLGNAVLYEQVTTSLAGSVRRLADGAIGTRGLLVKKGTNNIDVATCGAADLPLGSVDNTVADDEEVDLLLLGSECTQKLVASAAISVGAAVYTTASGKVQPAPTIAGVYYRVGIALTAAGADGDYIEVKTLPALRTRVLALPGNANGEISGLTIGASYDQGEVQALRTKCEELADDFRALAAETTEPTAFVWLAA